ncbi:MAG: tRNA (guanosine(37)-N1)-methyltransferase TrmD [Candidatus Pacebacteria bacterium]|jgi:tRNA (guanine37-N1)-methyltransferase|nr:tRNA (guanosine(37)-N1)-methyltransferase TrmD [Candidatus Paceibacterota bacterium]
MIIFDFITIFPEIVAPYFEGSLFAKARDKKLLRVRTHNLRDFASDRHHTVDDSPYGGGLGMVMKVDVWHKALAKVAKLKVSGKKFKPAKKDTAIVMLTPRGRKFDQRMAQKLAKMKQIVFVCGRYEGVDERVAKNIATMEVSIGDYDLMGGELAGMVIAETVARLIPGVIGKPEFLKERNGKEGFFESAQYTRPEVYSPKKGINWRVPKELLTGDPKKIGPWRQAHGKAI